MGVCASSSATPGRIDGDVVLTGVKKSDLTTVVAASLSQSFNADLRLVAAPGKGGKARAAFGTAPMDPLSLAALGAGKVRLDQWIYAAVGIPSAASPEPFLEVTSKLAALLATILSRPVDPPQTALLACVKDELTKLEVIFEVPTLAEFPELWPPTHRAAASAVLSWLVPAVEHSRSPSPLVADGKLKMLSLAQKSLGIIDTVRPDGFVMPMPGQLQNNWSAL